MVGIIVNIFALVEKTVFFYMWGSQPSGIRHGAFSFGPKLVQGIAMLTPKIQKTLHSLKIY